MRCHCSISIVWGFCWNYIFPSCSTVFYSSLFLVQVVFVVSYTYCLSCYNPLIFIFYSRCPSAIWWITLNQWTSSIYICLEPSVTIVRYVFSFSIVFVEAITHRSFNSPLIVVLSWYISAIKWVILNQITSLISVCLIPLYIIIRNIPSKFLVLWVPITHITIFNPSFIGISWYISTINRVCLN